MLPGLLQGFRREGEQMRFGFVGCGASLVLSIVLTLLLNLVLRACN